VRKWPYWAECGSFTAAIGFLSISTQLGPRTYLFTALFTGLTLVFVRGCLRGVAQPKPVLQVAIHLRRHEAHFRTQLPGTLAAEGQRIGDILAKRDNRIDPESAVLRRAERQQIDAGLPCHLGGRATQRGERIGEAGAVHMEREAGRSADLADRADLVERVDRSDLRRLR